MDRKDIADRISKVIQENPLNGKPLSSYQLARLGIMNSKTLSNILTLKVRPNPNTLVKFADYFHVSVEWLMTGVEPEPVNDEPSSKVYLEIIQRLTASLEARDKEIERLTKLLAEVSAASILPHEEDKGMKIPGRKRDDCCCKVAFQEAN